MPTIDVVTVNYRTEQSIEELGSGISELEGLGWNPRLWIVDCSQTLDAAWAAERSYPVVVIDPGANIGFGPACNLAMMRCDGDVCVLVNPDCVLDAKGFASVAAAGARDGAIAWTGVLLDPDGSIQRNTAPAFSLGVLVKEYLLGIATSLEPCSTTRTVGGATGALLFLDRVKVLDAGGFDERFPLYTEDIELTQRLGRRGRLLQFPDVVATHFGGAASKHHPTQTAALLHTSRIRYFQIRSAPQGLAARIIVVGGLALRAVLNRRTKTHASPAEVWRASAPGRSLSNLLPDNGQSGPPDLAPVELEETGERLHLLGPPETSDQWAHFERYQWAGTRVDGRVLDVASGTGYGSTMMSKTAKVVGAELEAAAIRFARAQQGTAARYVNCRIPSLPFANGSFDYVVSFETIEHVDDDFGFLVEIRRVLCPNGQLVLSTPNRAATSPDGPPANEFHVREYFLEELIDLLTEAGFVNIDIYGQYQEPRTFTGLVARRALGRAAAFGLDLTASRMDRAGHGSPKVELPKPKALPMFWVVTCSTALR